VRKLIAIIAGTAALLLVAAWPAGADTSIRPTFKQQDVFFHCNGETKIYNLNWTLELGDPASYVPWNATAPNQSVQGGGGCGGYDDGEVTNPVYDVVYSGSFTGNLRDATVRLHEVFLNNTRQQATQSMRIYAEVDGVPVFPGDPAAASWTGRTFTVTPQVENSGATALFEFSIWNLGYANYVYDTNGNLIDVQRGGVALENGDGTEEHTFMVAVGIDASPGGNPPAGGTLWAWDTTEVPSGITFNPPTLSAQKVKADLPDLSQAG
jgi:hypothetical protein